MGYGRRNFTVIEFSIITVGVLIALFEIYVGWPH
jgi:hypothetical protein